MENLATRRGTRIVALAAGAAVAATMACTLVCPANALTADGVAYSVDDQGNKTYYSSIDDAMSAGCSLKDNTIVMNEDWNVSKTLYVADSKKLVIDMNGHSIHSTDSDYVFRLYEHSTLELTSSKWNRFDYRCYAMNSSYNGPVTLSYSIGMGGLVTDDNEGKGLRMDSYSTLKLDYVAVAGNYRGGIDADTHCTVSMSNKAIITGNYCTTDGGAGINFENYGTLEMDNASITENSASEKSGGGVYVNSNAHISMENNSTIKGNVAKSGGGICFSGSYNYLTSEDKTGSISRNTAYSTSDQNEDSGGGGIQVKKKSFGTNETKIQGITVDSNRSLRSGGGIELLQEYTYISDCTITGNAADINGGGIYVNNDNNHLSSCNIKDNVCNNIGGANNYEGGGVYVDRYDDIYLHGVCIITGNTRGKNGSADDLFLGDDSSAVHAYIVGGVNKGTKVGVRTGTTGNRKIAKDLESNCYGAFFMDLNDYYVSYERDNGGNMWQDKGALKFMVNVNGKETTRYKQGETVTIDGSVQDADRVFWRWDADATTGLYPLADFINEKTKYNPILTYSMPQNDTNAVAVYAARVKKAYVAISGPVAGEELTSHAEFRRLDTGLGAQRVVPARVNWYEVKADGTKVATAGKAKTGTSYVASVTVEQNQKLGLFFSCSMAADNIIVCTSSDDSKGDKTASAFVDESTGALIVGTGEFRTAGETSAEDAVDSLTVELENGGLRAAANESSKSAQDVDGCASLGSVKVTYAAGSESVTVAAPSIEGMKFCYWGGVHPSWCDDVSDDCITIPAGDLAEATEVVAVYTPVVTSIELGLTAPKAGKTLATSATSFTAHTSDGQSVDFLADFGAKSFEVAWSQSAKKAACSTVYSAAVRIAEDIGFYGLEGMMADGAPVAFSNGAKATSAGFAVVDGKLCLCLVAPETGKVASVSGLKAAKAGKGAVKMSWKKGDRSGVQVRYSTAKTMKGAKKVTVKGKAVKTKTIKKLKSGKRYYFQVRAYKTVNGLKCYSSWSEKVSVKVK